MTDAQMDKYAASLASAAVASTGAPIDAACVLMQAAAAVMVAHTPRADAMKAFETLAACTAETFSRIILPQETVQ